MKKIKTNHICPITRLFVWVMRKNAEARREKWTYTPEYDEAVNAMYDIIEKNRAFE